MFDSVLIADNLSESLTLMQRDLCWSTEDVLALKQNVRLDRERHALSEPSKTALRMWLADEYRLYNHFSAVHRRKVAELGRRGGVIRHAERLEAINGELKRTCVVAERDKSSQAWWDEEEGKGFKAVAATLIDRSRPWCRPYARQEVFFARDIRNWMRFRGKRKWLQVA